MICSFPFSFFLSFFLFFKKLKIIFFFTRSQEKELSSFVISDTEEISANEVDNLDEIDGIDTNSTTGSFFDFFFFQCIKFYLFI